MRLCKVFFLYVCLGSRWHWSKIKTSHCAFSPPLISAFQWCHHASQTLRLPKSSGRMNSSQVEKQSASEGESVKKKEEHQLKRRWSTGHPPSTEGRPGGRSTSSKTKCFPAACLLCACRSRRSRSSCCRLLCPWVPRCGQTASLLAGVCCGSFPHVWQFSLSQLSVYT